MSYKEQRAAELKAAKDIAARAKAENRDLTDDESAQIQSHVKNIEDLDGKAKRAAENAKLLGSLGALGDDEEQPQGGQPTPAKSLGEFAAKHMHARIKETLGVQGASVSSPEYKANTDTHVVGSVFQNPVLTQFDRTIIQDVRPRLVVADLLGSGSLSGNAISYFVEGALEGAFTTVAEGAAKPQLHVVDPTLVTDALNKIAGWIKLTDEMVEDLDFFVSEINSRLLYELGKFEEAQVLNGNGSGTNLLGLLNRSGIQTETSADNTDNADAIFRAMTKVGTGAGLDADGVVIHPTDYQNLRLRRDGNEQYYGGGYFQGQYGNGTMADQPPIWGLRTVVTPAIAAGTALVGAFAQGGTLYRKGGVRVESTNSHASDFTSNLVTVRVEERVALAVRRPAGFVKVTLNNVPPV